MSDIRIKYRSAGKVRSFTAFGFPLIIPLFFVLEKLFPSLSAPAVAFLSFFIYLAVSALISLLVLERKIDLVFGMLTDRESDDERVS